MLTKNTLDVYFHLEYFLSCENFCKDGKKNYFPKIISVFSKKMNGAPF